MYVRSKQDDTLCADAFDQLIPKEILGTFFSSIHQVNHPTYQLHLLRPPLRIPIPLLVNTLYSLKIFEFCLKQKAITLPLY